MGAIGYVGQAVCFFAALNHASAGLVALLLYAYPTLVVLLSAAFLGERLTAAKIALLAASFAGLALTLGGGQGTATGIALGARGGGVLLRLHRDRRARAQAHRRAREHHRRLPFARRRSSRSPRFVTEPRFPGAWQGLGRHRRHRHRVDGRLDPRLLRGAQARRARRSPPSSPRSSPWSPWRSRGSSWARRSRRCNWPAARSSSPAPVFLARAH